VIAPPAGCLWTANARVVDGEMLRTVGDGGYDLGSRARQIRDSLCKLEGAVPRDLLAIQLDDRALFLERWRDLLLAALTDAAVAADPRRAELRRAVEGWGGHAAIDSVGYRMVRAFRLTLAEQAFAPLIAPCKAADARFDYRG
jgi:penicillin amidase